MHVLSYIPTIMFLFSTLIFLNHISSADLFKYAHACIWPMPMSIFDYKAEASKEVRKIGGKRLQN